MKNINLKIRKVALAINWNKMSYKVTKITKTKTEIKAKYKNKF